MISIQIKGLDKLRKKILSTPEKYIANTDLALRRIMTKIQGDAIQNAPKGRSKDLAKGIKTEFSLLTGKVKAEAPYSNVVDKGRRPGKYAPVDKLQEWVKWKFGISNPKQLKQATFLINRKIKEKGIDGTKFFSNAVDKNRTFIESEIKKILKGL